VAPTESKSSKTRWDLSAIGGREVQEGADVSSVVASALFRQQSDERHILAEFGKASRLFVPDKPGKENARGGSSFWDLMLSIRDALGLGCDFVPNVQLDRTRRFLATRQIVHLCATVMAFDITLSIPDAWEGWIKHRHLTDGELQTFLSLDTHRISTIPAMILRPTASLFTLFQDARKLAEPGRGGVGAAHPHRMVWDAYRPAWQLLVEFYYDDPRLCQAHGVLEAGRRQGNGDIDLVFFSSAYAFMRFAALKRKARDNPPPDELLALEACMPRSPSLKIDNAIIRYLNDETDELPYASEKCSLENPLGLLTVSPRAHKTKHWCVGVVPVDIADWPAFTASQEGGFFRICDPRNVDVLELHRQTAEMVVEVLGI
jgi:hypothetical protein